MTNVDAADEVAESSSRVTIGLTAKGADALNALMAKNWFGRNNYLAMQMAVAFAIANDIPMTTEGSFTTIWNIGTFDKTGEFKSTIGIFIDDSNIWDAIQRLGDAGLRVIETRLSSASFPSEIFITKENEST